MTSTARSSDLILALDQGTTGSKALLVDSELRAVVEATREFPQHYPAPDRVEHDPEQIFASVRGAVIEALQKGGIDPGRIAAVGITNQRETTIVEERDSGRAIGPAIVWQDRRTAPRCQELKERGVEPLVRGKTGLLLDPYFSATKIGWLLDNLEGARRGAEEGRLRAGTIDTWLVGRLTAGAAWITDVSNASRTLLMDLRSGKWDPELLELFGVPSSLLSEIRDGDSVVGHTRGLDFLPDGIPIAAPIGDQQAALFAQGCYAPGEAKCTYGTGAFVMLNTGGEPIEPEHGLLSTAAWRRAGRTTYALEGSCFVAGAIVQWLRDGLGLIERADEVEELASSVPDTRGVTLVPALTGLGAPHWDPGARGLITGLTRGTTAGHLARAALEGIAFEVNDVLVAMRESLGHPVTRLQVDGGASRSELLVQFQADLLGAEVVRAANVSATALGAAMVAGLAVGLFPSLAALAEKGGGKGDRFSPSGEEESTRQALERWRHALRQTLTR